MIATQIKGSINPVKNEKQTYRSFKGFDSEVFVEDIRRAPFHVPNIFDDIDDAYWRYETLLTDIADKHAPLKSRRPRKNKAPFMNSTPQKMLFNKYTKCRNSRNWEAFRTQRNLVTKICRKSIKTYFFERCAGGPKSKEFWPTIKPFLSKCSSKSNNKIILSEGDKIITDQNEVANIFNDHFVNVAQGIGDIKPDTDLTNHPSIEAIKEIYMQK